MNASLMSLKSAAPRAPDIKGAELFGLVPFRLDGRYVYEVEGLARTSPGGDRASWDELSPKRPLSQPNLKMSQTTAIRNNSSTAFAPLCCLDYHWVEAINQLVGPKSDAAVEALQKTEYQQVPLADFKEQWIWDAIVFKYKREWCRSSSHAFGASREDYNAPRQWIKIPSLQSVIKAFSVPSPLGSS